MTRTMRTTRWSHSQRDCLRAHHLQAACCDSAHAQLASEQLHVNIS